MPDNARSFFGRLCHSSISRIATVALIMLAWSGLAVSDEIHDAAKSGDSAKVQALLKANPVLVFSKDSKGDTPLHLAAENGHKGVAELLLANKADVNAKDNGGMTPLHLAALWHSKSVMELLLAHHADVNVKDNDGRTPLHLAVDGPLLEYRDVLELLLANHADVNAPANDGVTPFQLATLNGHPGVAELLQQHAGTAAIPIAQTVDLSDPNVLRNAVQTGNVGLARLSIGKQKSANRDELLSLAAANRDVQMVMLLKGYVAAPSNLAQAKLRNGTALDVCRGRVPGGSGAFPGAYVPEERFVVVTELPIQTMSFNKYNQIQNTDFMDTIYFISELNAGDPNGAVLGKCVLSMDGVDWRVREFRTCPPSADSVCLRDAKN